MKYKGKALVKQLSTTCDYSTSEKTYSPFFSSIGLVTTTEATGVNQFFLHYNRATRSIWNKFMCFPLSLNKKQSKIERLSYGDNDASASLAFYMPDAFVFTACGVPCVNLFNEPADGLVETWIVKHTATELILRGYSKNGDNRDPDTTVPFLCAVKVKCGAVYADDGGIVIKKGCDGISFSFAFEALDISESRILQKVRQAPCIDLAEEKCLNWALKNLDSFELNCDNDKEAELAASALHGLLFNLTMGQGNLSRHVSSYPNRGKYPCHFLWDTCFENLAHEAMSPTLACDLLLQFADTQRCDGKYEQFICSTWGRPHYSQSPLIGWATLRASKLTGDRVFTKRMLSSLEKNTNWWLSQRMTPCGLISCEDGLETGQDDSPRFDNGTTIPCDMNSYLLNQMRSIAEVALMLEQPAKSAVWSKKADAFAQKMVDILYCESDEVFYDVSIDTGEFVKIITPCCFLPMWAGVPLNETDIKNSVERYLLEPSFLFGAVPFPSVAYKAEEYIHDKWWRGPTWLPTAWLMLETLERCGYIEEKDLAKCRLYNMLIKDMDMHELFDSETGEGLGSAQQGWSCAIFLKLLCDK